MPIKLPSFADALPLTLGEKLPTPNSIKPSEEWDLVRHDSRGALWKNCAGGRLQFIPNPSTLGPQKDPGKIPPALQQALDSVGAAIKTTLNIGDSCRMLSSGSILTFLGVQPKGELFAGDFIAKDSSGAIGLYNQSNTQRLFPCDADGWIPHTPGDPMPCDGDLEVEIMTRTEVEGSTPRRPEPQPAEDWEWSVNLSPPVQILAWKPAL